jgi:nicotinate-nucleotide adenylyltransferase
MGSDAFMNLGSWHLWNELFNYCHILIVERRESPIREDQLTSTLKKEWGDRLTRDIEDLRRSSHGLIMAKQFEYIDVSSSQIREAIYSNKNPMGLLPAEVADYISLNKLYR